MNAQTVKSNREVQGQRDDIGEPEFLDNKDEKNVVSRSLTAMKSGINASLNLAARNPGPSAVLASAVIISSTISVSAATVASLGPIALTLLATLELFGIALMLAGIARTVFEMVLKLAQPEEMIEKAI